MSLWPVSDYITRETMTAFYTGLKHGLGRGEALRQASERTAFEAGEK
jgi:CHAT domain-containing protein